MNFIDRAQILIQAKLKERETKKLFNLSRAQNIAKWATIANISPHYNSYPLRPDYSSFLDKYKHNIESIDRPVDTIAYGDSILDFTRDKLTAIDNKLNFAVAGFGSPNMVKMALDLDDILTKHLIKNQIKYVVLGCFGGNPLLSHQDFELIKHEAKSAFLKLRTLYPTAKFIVYGLPPVYDVYATINASAFELFMIDLAIKDGNAIFLPLQKKFAGLFGIFPKIEYSSDTVHLGAKGIARFDQLLNQAKTCSLNILD